MIGLTQIRIPYSKVITNIKLDGQILNEEVESWLNENVGKGMYHPVSKDEHDGYQWTWDFDFDHSKKRFFAQFYFVNQDDAILFKLTFGGDQCTMYNVHVYSNLKMVKTLKGMGLRLGIDYTTEKGATEQARNGRIILRFKDRDKAMMFKLLSGN